MDSHCSLETQRLTKFSRYSGEILSSSCLVAKLKRVYAIRILGTPTEDDWPGLKQLPDYKPTFPHWNAQDLSSHIPPLDDDGIDLLKVCYSISWIVQAANP